MNDLKESELNQELDLLLAQRAIEPDASGLVEKIIFESQDLPQDSIDCVSEPEWYNRIGSIIRDRLPRVRPLVATGALGCLTLVVMSGVWFLPQTRTIKVQPIVQNISNDLDTLSEEFNWDNLLIMQDELAFAGL